MAADASGTLYVNGEEVPEDPWEDEYGEQMPTAVLRLAARAGSAGADLCLEVELPSVTVTGFIDISGEVVAARGAPMETPPPPEPAPTQPPTYGLPMIDGVVISDPMLDINSYPLVDLADVLEVPACIEVQADANDVVITVSLEVCASARLETDGGLAVLHGELEWNFEPESLEDHDEALAVGEAVEVGLDFRNVMDDGIHLIELGVTVEGDCPDLDP